MFSEVLDVKLFCSGELDAEVWYSSYNQIINSLVKILFLLAVLGISSFSHLQEFKMLRGLPHGHMEGEVTRVVFGVSNETTRFWDSTAGRVAQCT